ncbi:hypothetical protein BJ322DRAFT_1217675 [Thelephora terrestris]|uniref:Uncharacterized protein n=1 Tax=Thelephora terrestris TaxID=56493 RepID=A0A9P6HK20_9AGAM|nr:hypothetical protein BJ322DRAFT_1217675 [Thelephora terrestris]
MLGDVRDEDEFGDQAIVRHASIAFPSTVFYWVLVASGFRRFLPLWNLYDENFYTISFGYGGFFARFHLVDKSRFQGVRKAFPPAGRILGNTDRPQADSRCWSTSPAMNEPPMRCTAQGHHLNFQPAHKLAPVCDTASGDHVSRFSPHLLKRTSSQSLTPTCPPSERSPSRSTQHRPTLKWANPRPATSSRPASSLQARATRMCGFILGKNTLPEGRALSFRRLHVDRAWPLVGLSDDAATLISAREDKVAAFLCTFPEAVLVFVVEVSKGLLDVFQEICSGYGCRATIHLRFWTQHYPSLDDGIKKRLPIVEVDAGRRYLI